MKNRSAASLLKRLYLYTSERFPLASHGAAIFIFFLSAYLIAQALSDSPVNVGWEAGAGFLTLLLVFFRIRIMDEFKDAGEDAQYHPERPVPRGLITLGELRIVGIAAAVIEIGLNLWMGISVLLSTKLKRKRNLAMNGSLKEHQ